MKSAHVKSGCRHVIRNGRVNLRGCAKFLPCQIDTDQRVSRHAVRTNAKGKRIKHLLHRNVPGRVGIAHRTARNHGNVHRYSVKIIGVLHGIHIGVRHQVTQIVFRVLILEIMQRGKLHIIGCKHLILGVTEIREITGIHRFHEAINLLLGRSVRSDGRKNRNQLIIRYLPSAIALLGHGKFSDLSAVLSRGYNIRVAVHDRLRELCVGMTADNQVKIRHTLGKNLILGFALILPRTAV